MKGIMVDFGSTYTKVTLVNLDPPGLIGTSQAPTTVTTDLMDGLHQALGNFSTKELQGITVKRACSSAAGGLRIVAIGLVPALTVKAAREAALGAGARVLKTFAFTLTEQEISEIRELHPDLLLLAGGTDGGERRTILDNAAAIAESGLEIPVVYAGNKVAAAQAVELLHHRVPRVVVADNVMPEVNRLYPDSAREAIREIYLAEITKAKGLERVQELAGLAMPTPLAVMKCGGLIQQLLQRDVIIVDIGGATTDVHSFAEGKPTRSGVVCKGLPEPFTKRTVEGDLGMRVSIISLLEAVGEERVVSYLSSPPEPGEIAAYVARANEEHDYLPVNGREEEIERALAASCINEAIRRHVGTLVETYTPEGRLWIQRGKDLSDTGLLVGTGGVLVHSEQPGELLQRSLKMEKELVLAPRHPEIRLDQHYILSAIGLLAEVDTDAAKALIDQTLVPVGRYEQC